jgi:murein DD-endopeptidase
LTRGSMTLAPRPLWPLAPLELLPTLSALFKTHGSADLTLAAFFLGPEAVTRALSRLKPPGERVDLDKLASRLPRGSAGALRYAREARTRALLFGLAWPVERSWRVTSRFGPRIHPILGGTSEHRGVDLGAPLGTEVHAAADGVVASVQDGPVNGRMLELRHEGGVRTVYCHLSQVEVKPGQKVRVGEPVAHSGATGRVTGPHLHYQVQFAGDWVDPVRIRASARLVAEPFPWESEEFAAPSPAAMR